MPKRSWIRISQVRTLAVERMGRRPARASDEEVDRVVAGLNLDLARQRLRSPDTPRHRPFGSYLAALEHQVAASREP